MALQIVVKYLLGHFALKPSSLIEIIIDLFLEVHKVFILSCRFQSHKILRNELLSLNRMEEFLVSNQISTSFLGVFHLLELDYEDVVQLLEVLLHVIDEHLARAVELHLFEFAVHVLFQLLDVLFVFHHLSIILIHIKLIVKESTLILIHVFIQVHSHSSNLTIRLTDLIDHLFPEFFMDRFVFG